MGGSITYSRSNIGQIPVPNTSQSLHDEIASIARDLQGLADNHDANAEFDSGLAELNKLIAAAFEVAPGAMDL